MRYLCHRGRLLPTILLLLVAGSSCSSHLGGHRRAAVDLKVGTVTVDEHMHATVPVTIRFNNHSPSFIESIRHFHLRLNYRGRSLEYRGHTPGFAVSGDPQPIVALLPDERDSTRAVIHVIGRLRTGAAYPLQEVDWSRGDTLLELFFAVRDTINPSGSVIGIGLQCELCKGCDFELRASPVTMASSIGNKSTARRDQQIREQQYNHHPTSKSVGMECGHVIVPHVIPGDLNLDRTPFDGDDMARFALLRTNGSEPSRPFDRAIWATDIDRDGVPLTDNDYVLMRLQSNPPLILSLSDAEGSSQETFTLSLSLERAGSSEFKFAGVAGFRIRLLYGEHLEFRGGERGTAVQNWEHFTIAPDTLLHDPAHGQIVEISGTWDLNDTIPQTSQSWLTEGQIARLTFAVRERKSELPLTPLPEAVRIRFYSVTLRDNVLSDPVGDYLFTALVDDSNLVYSPSLDRRAPVPRGYQSLPFLGYKSGLIRITR